jgi:putative membrane protein
MKHRRILVALGATLILTAACHHEATDYTTTDNTATTVETTGTAQAASDTSTATATNTAPMTAAASLSAEDQEFVMKAGMGGIAEVQMGNLAQQKASSADVKAFGQRMVSDHSKANQELSQLATTKGVTLPNELSGEHKEAYDHLSSMSGKDFDKMYMNHMVEDHEKDVSEFQKASTSAQDQDLKAWAGKTLPTLQQHLQLAKDVNGKVK